MHAPRILLSASFMLAGVVLLGRLSGFFREIQIAALFGLSAEADFAVVLLTTPDLLTNLLLTGGLSAALVPEFRSLDRPGRSRLFLSVAATVTGIFGVFGLIIAIFPDLLVVSFAPAYAGQAGARWKAFALMALAIPLASLSGVTSALLNSQERFFVAGAGTLVFNLTLIAVLFLLAANTNLLAALAAAVAAGALLRAASQVAAAAPLVDWRAPASSASTGLFRRFAAGLGAATLILLVPVIIRSAISFTGEGIVAAFNYATKLIELPIGIAIASVATVAFTRLSDLIATGRTDDAGRALATGTVAAVLVGVSICVPAIWFADALSQIVFGRGRMTTEAVALVADLAAIGLLTLPLVAVSSMATAMLNARKRPDIALRWTAASLLVIPLAMIPGVALGDPRLAMAAIPVFHLTLAFVLARAAGLSIPRSMVAAAPRRLVLIALPICAAVAADYLLPNASVWVRVGLAISAMACAILLSGARSMLAWFRL